MGKCCSKPQKEEHYEEEFQEVLLDVDPGGDDTMTGGTLVVRTPGRWQVTTTRDIPIAAAATRKTNRVITTTGPKNGTATGAPVAKTYRFNNGGSTAAQSVVTYNGGSGGKGRMVTKTSTNVTKGSGNGSPLLQQRATGQIITSRSKNLTNNAKSIFTITPPRMGKTVTETATRVYTKDGRRFQETVETVTEEDAAGNISKSTKTITKELDPFDTKDMAAAIDKAKTKSSKGGARKSSTSSDDSSPERKATKHKSKPAEKSGKGLLNKIKSKATGGKSSSSDDSSDEEDFIEDVHKGINQYRSKHGVKTLKLSKEMNKYAKEWARKLAAEDKMSHRPDGKYGENVYCVSSNSKTFKIKGDEVVDKWYSEVKNHVFGEEPKGSLLKSGHLTQMLWKDTKQLGVGKARSAAGTKIFVVANFDPQGNWMGQFATQVPPVGGFPKSALKEKALPSKVAVSRKSSSSSSSSSDSSDEEDFAEDCLKAHNNYRKKHGVPPLKLSKDLSKFAENWAKKIAKKNMMEHRDPNEYGENIYSAWSSNPNHKIKGDEAVESWYSEIKDYTFGREPSDLRAGHFTQVLWKGSKELGLGVARSSTGKIFVVANYNPAGNMVGSFDKNVPKPK